MTHHSRILLLCVLLAFTVCGSVAFAVVDAGPEPPDAYTDGTVIFEDRYSGLICDNDDVDTTTDYEISWSSPDPKGTVQFDDDDDTRRCGLTGWVISAQGRRAHTHLNRVKVGIHQDTASVISVEICVDYWSSGSRTEVCTSPKTTASTGFSLLDFTWYDLSGIHTISTSEDTYMWIKAEYTGSDPETDLPRLTGAYIRWRYEQ